MNKIKSILFVCTGNSCRSVMAEGLLKKSLSQLGRSDIKVNSAGLMALSAGRPTEETIGVMKAEGVDVSGHKTKGVTADDIRTADLVLTMEEFQRQELIERVPEAAGKIYLLKAFGNGNKVHYCDGCDIPDPIGQTVRGYEHCLDMIKKEIERIVKLL